MARNLELTPEAEAILTAIEYAPSSGPTAPDLMGVWTPEGWFVCAPCVGRIIARGCGDVLSKGEQVWRDREEDARGVCLCCESAK